MAMQEDGYAVAGVFGNRASVMFMLETFPEAKIEKNRRKSSS